MKKSALTALGAALMAGTSSLAVAQDAPIIIPGAPGEAGQVVGEKQAIALSDTRYAPGDVTFMQGMILHHQQAVEMSELVPGRTNNEDVVALAEKILASQADEISFMQSWLTARGEKAPQVGNGLVSAGHSGHSGHGAHAGHAGHHGGGEWADLHASMSGMASAEDMAKLATLEGSAFDDMFLRLMIAHHEGAIEMVEDLHRQPGTAYDPELFRFSNDVVSDQTSEIEQMNGILAGLSSDPRAGLAAGFRDAEEAILNLRLVAAMPKPTGFFDPANPAQLQPRIKSKEEEQDAADAEAAAAGNDPRLDDEDEGKPQFGKRGSLLDFANTDMAFSGNMLVTGNYHGWNAYNLGDDGKPELLSSIVCPGGQGDVSIVGDLLIMSVQGARARVDCGLQGVPDRISEERFRGIRIFDISDIRAPVQVGQVQTCRGSHTHSIVSVDDKRIVVYNSGTSYLRDEKELAGCIRAVGDDRTALFSIDVIEIPVSNPGAAKIIDSPRVFAKDGQIAGLWRGGDHGEGTQDTARTDHCHDITVFPSLNIAAGACSGNGVVFDITDPLKPERIDDVTDKGFAYWHSATFNNDGTKVLFTDEWGGGGRPRCQAGDPKNWGANAFYTLKDGKLEFESLWKLPAPQSDKENCVAHNGSIIPVPGRDIFVQAWYQGGISVIDFTDAANPFEIAYFDRGPVDEEQLITGGYWSAYWYKGRIYATEITRGLDVFALEPSEFLTAEEIAAAEAAQYEDGLFNPQTQTRVTWDESVIEAAEESRKGG